MVLKLASWFVDVRSPTACRGVSHQCLVVIKEKSTGKEFEITVLPKTDPKLHIDPINPTKVVCRDCNLVMDFRPRSIQSCPSCGVVEPSIFMVHDAVQDQVQKRPMDSEYREMLDDLDMKNHM